MDYFKHDHNIDKRNQTFTNVIPSAPELMHGGHD